MYRLTKDGKSRPKMKREKIPHFPQKKKKKKKKKKRKEETLQMPIVC